MELGGGMSTTVTLHYLGGPEDGYSRPFQRAAGGMPDVVDGYQLIGPHPYDAAVWRYAWMPPRTGLRHPCRAGDEQWCPGGRCPSQRRRQPA